MFFSKSCLKFVLKSLLFAGFCQKQLGRRSTASFWIVGGGRRGPTFNLRKSYNRGRAGILFGAYRVFFPFTGFLAFAMLFAKLFAFVIVYFFFDQSQSTLVKKFFGGKRKGRDIGVQ